MIEMKCNMIFQSCDATGIMIGTFGAKGVVNSTTAFLRSGC